MRRRRRRRRRPPPPPGPVPALRPQVAHLGGRARQEQVLERVEPAERLSRTGGRPGAGVVGGGVVGVGVGFGVGGGVGARRGLPAQLARQAQRRVGRARQEEAPAQVGLFARAAAQRVQAPLEVLLRRGVGGRGLGDVHCGRGRVRLAGGGGGGGRRGVNADGAQAGLDIGVDVAFEADEGVVGMLLVAVDGVVVVVVDADVAAVVWHDVLKRALVV